MANLAIDAGENDLDSDEDSEDQPEEKHQRTIEPDHLSQFYDAQLQHSIEICGSVWGTHTQLLYDMESRIVRKRVNKKAVAYFANHSPYGEQVKEHCLVQMLES